jgi:peptide/nickel transport system permease protein
MRRLDPWLLAGVILCGLLLIIALYGDRIAPFEPTFSVLNVADRAPYPLPPGDPFVFGSDPAGRDLLSVILNGARTTLTIVALAGLARLAVGAALASVSWAAPVRAVLDALADVVSAVPSTIVAVIVVLVFATLEAPSLVFVLALLVTGWAGPYRIVRAELTRLRAALFTEGARALGVRRRDLLLRHHLPHLVPVLALTASQQVAAALVALAELGVIGVFVGPVRYINLANSLSLVRVGERAGGFASESSEWSAMLATGRAMENLYVTRWVVLVPGVAIALAVLAVSMLGIGIARHYRRRNLLTDLRPKRVAAIAGVLVVMVAPSFVLPDRFAAARDRADDARSRTVVGADVTRAFADSGIASVPVDRTASLLKSIGPAIVDVTGPAGQFRLSEGPALLPVLAGKSSGGSVDAPVVFAGWGISPADFPSQRLSNIQPPDFGSQVSTWEDDYRKVGVKGKIALIIRLTNIRLGSRMVGAPSPDQIIAKAIDHGAVAVILIDSFRAPTLAGTGANTYKRMGVEDPIRSASGVPTVVITPEAADRILEPAALRATDILRATNRDLSRDYTNGVSMAVALRETGHVEVPVAAVSETSHNHLALTPARPDGHRLVLWAVAPSAIDGSRSAADALAAAVRSLRGRPVPGLAIVSFDPRGDTAANAKELIAAIGGPIDLIVLLDSVAGQRLRFRSTYDDLFFPFDRYADRAGVTHARTLGEDEPTWATGLAAMGRFKYIVVAGDGTPSADVDLRADAAALLGYVVARYDMGSPELHQ